MPVNEVDPATFLRKADKCINYDACGYLGYHLYVNYLAKMLVLGGSLYFVLLLNVLYFVISIYFFIGIAELLSLNENRKVYLLLYGIWPSVVYFTTLHYREPFELYLLMAGIYFGLSGGKNESFPRLLVSMILLFAMGLFHIKGLLFLSAIIFLIVSMYKFTYSKEAILKRLILLAMMCAGIYFSYTMYTKNISLVSSSPPIESVKSIISDKTTNASMQYTVKTGFPGIGIDKDDVVQVANNKNKFVKEKDDSFIEKMINKIMNYRAILLSQRELGTAFITTINDKNLITFLVTFAMVYFEYLFSPFIFQVNTFHEFIAYVESLLRVALFISALIILKKNPHTRLLFIIYLAVTAMWTIGVVSFGAGIRHHIMTNWILVLLGVPAISEYVKMKIAEKKDARGTIK